MAAKRDPRKFEVELGASLVAVIMILSAVSALGSALALVNPAGESPVHNQWASASGSVSAGSVAGSTSPVAVNNAQPASQLVVPPTQASSDRQSGSTTPNDKTTDGGNAWKAAMLRNPPTQRGCNVAGYGSTAWQQSECIVMPQMPSVPSRGVSVVGNIIDYVANSSSTLIGSVVGSFPAISGLTSEYGGPWGAFPKATCSGGNYLPNCYELQINTQNFWSSSSWTGGAPYKMWEQFLYGNPAGGGSGGVYIEFWIFGWAAAHGGTCPSGTVGGGTWFATDFSKKLGINTDCTVNTNGMPVPNVPITSLGKLTFSAYANYEGSGNDVDTLCISGGSCYSDTLPANTLNLYQHWYEAEFNVFGNENGAQAFFNVGTTIEVSNALTDGSGNPITPASSCPINGTTGEANDLFLGLCSTSSSGMLFTESSQLYSLTSTPSSVTVLAGRTATYPMQVTLVAGTAAPVALSVVSGLPAGAIATFSSNPVTPTASTTLTVSTPTSVTLGDYTLTIQGQFGVYVNYTTLKLHIYDFTVDIAYQSETVLRGTTAVYSVNLTLLPGSSTTGLPAELLSVSGLPSDSTHFFSVGTETPTTVGCTFGTLEDCQYLSVTTKGPPSGSLGNFLFKVTATDPDPSGGSRSSTAELRIFDFTVVVTPISRTTLRGTSTVYALTLELVSGSSTTGVPAMALTVSGLPSDATYLLSASSETPTLVGCTIFTLQDCQTLSVTTAGPPSGSLGDFPFTVTATDPQFTGGSRSASPSLHIFDFTVTLLPTTETLVQGGSVTMTVSLALVPGSTTIGLPSISMSLLGLPSGVIAVGFPASMAIGTTDSFTLEPSTVASYVNCPQVYNGGEQDLIFADLADCNLAGYDLQGDMLFGANLFGANLENANLAGADLEDANLASANVAGTDFQGADLEGADLSSAFPYGIFELTAVGSVDGGSRSSGPALLTVLGEELSSDNFYGANLQDANLTADVLTGSPSQLTDFDLANLAYANLTNAVCGSPNDITARGADTQYMIDVPGSCDPPLGHALSEGLTSSSPLSPTSALPLILGLGVVGAVVAVVVGRRRPRRPTSLGREAPSPRPRSRPEDGRTERRLAHVPARSSPIRTAKCPDEVIRKARAAQAALIAQGEFYSASLLGDTADMLEELAGRQSERREASTVYR